MGPKSPGTARYGGTIKPLGHEKGMQRPSRRTLPPNHRRHRSPPRSFENNWWRQSHVHLLWGDPVAPGVGWECLKIGKEQINLGVMILPNKPGDHSAQPSLNSNLPNLNISCAAPRPLTTTHARHKANPRTVKSEPCTTYYEDAQITISHLPARPFSTRWPRNGALAQWENELTN